MDLNGSWSFAFIGSARWVGFRLDLISAAVLAAAALLVMVIHNKVFGPSLNLHVEDEVRT